MWNASSVRGVAGRIYVEKLYPVRRDRAQLIDVVRRGIERAGGRVLFSSFDHERVAPMYLGTEDASGARWGLLVYPFRTTKRSTKNRPDGEHRSQIRFGDPSRVRDERNPIARDVAGVDVTLVLTIDPELDIVVGLDPLVYEQLPMGASVFYSDEEFRGARTAGWAVWEREKRDGLRRDRLVELETMVGFSPERIFDYVRFEAAASALGLSPALRATLALEYVQPRLGPHRLESVFGLESREILDIIDANFRLGVAVRGGVAERHLERVLATDPAVESVESIDEDGKPDFRVVLGDGRTALLECKTASGSRYAGGDFKVEVQKTRASAAGRQYTFRQFDILAACLFSATGVWEYRYRWTRDLEPLASDSERIKPIQRIDNGWARSLAGLVEHA
jgi:hypothetical protein